MTTGSSPQAYRRLFEPLVIGNIEIANRIVNPTHGTFLDRDRELRYLRERARGGAGFIGLVGHLGVNNWATGPIGRKESPGWDETYPNPATEEGIAFFDELAIPLMREQAEVIHSEGSACFAQVVHQGHAPHWPRLSPPVGPSAVMDPYDALMPHPLSEAEIEEIIVAHAHGIRRIRDAGIDAAEIHAAHGYLIHEFLSPYTNLRTDQWGGSQENRLRFLTRIIEEARKLVGEYPIGVRLGIDGDGDVRGMTIADVADVAAAIGNDVDYISVTGGNYAGYGEGDEPTYTAPWYEEPGYNAPAGAAIKKRVNIPVLVTGRIADAAIAEGMIVDGSADMVGMVRALIADPELPKKIHSGRAHEARMCLGLSECHYIGKSRTPINCAVNASAGREKEFELVPASTPKTVVVVGAGPAGMEAARVAALRGHQVYLADIQRQIGGTPRLLGRDPNRRNMLDNAAFFETQFADLNIELMLGNRVTAEELIEFEPDAVVLATGGVPLVPEQFADGSSVVTALDVITGKANVGKKVLVAGGLDAHLAGPTVAEFLADQGADVEFVSEQLDFAHGAEDGTRVMIAGRLARKGVRVSLAHRLLSYDVDGATVQELFTKKERSVPGVDVVLACGLVPNNELENALRGHIPEVHVIGDALAPRRLMHATHDGARVGRLL